MIHSLGQVLAIFGMPLHGKLRECLDPLINKNVNDFLFCPELVLFKNGLIVQSLKFSPDGLMVIISLVKQY